MHTVPRSVLQTLSAALGMDWHCPFTLSMKAISGDVQARQVYPKNLTIRFGAHRAFVYGGTPTAKTTAFTAACKDPI